MASSRSGEAPANPIVITDLESTLSDERTLAAFRTFLRTLDNKTSIKGRFERTLDAIIYCRRILDLPEESRNEIRELMINFNRLFFDCDFDKRVAVPAQVALRTYKSHCWSMDYRTSTVPPDRNLVRPIFEAVYRKIQSKHDYWKKNYKPTTTLRALLCVLS